MKHKVLPNMDSLEAERFLSKIKQGSDFQCWPWIMKPDQYGYGLFRIRGTNIRAHRLSYKVFKNHDPGDLIVCHNCDNKICCNPNHLTLADNMYNSKDMVSKGRQKKGKDHPMSKLDDNIIHHIRDMYVSGLWTYKELAWAFGLSWQMVSDIVKRRKWKHI